MEAYELTLLSLCLWIRAPPQLLKAGILEPHLSPCVYSTFARQRLSSRIVCVVCYAFHVLVLPRTYSSL